MEEVRHTGQTDRYRNKAQFPVSRGKDGKVKIGFFAGHTHSVIDTAHCYIQAPVMQPLLETIREFLEEYDISTYDEETGKGLVRHILMRVGFATGEIMVCPVLNGEKLPKAEVLETRLKETVKRYNEGVAEQGITDVKKADSITMGNAVKYELTSFCINVNKKKTNVILGDKCILLSGREYITDKIGDISYRISPLSFYQVNPVQTEILYNTAIAYAGLSGKELVLDAYCGIGTIGLIASAKAKEVIGVELNRMAVKDAIANAKKNGITNAKFYAGDAGEFMERYAADGKRPDVVFMDPPRSGSTEQFINSLLIAAPKKVVYVSCNPETLVRDLKLITKGGYKVERAVGVDQFPFTSHCEVCVQLRRT